MNLNFWFSWLFTFRKLELQAYTTLSILGGTRGRIQGFLLIRQAYCKCKNCILNPQTGVLGKYRKAVSDKFLKYLLIIIFVCMDVSHVLMPVYHMHVVFTEIKIHHIS